MSLIKAKHLRRKLFRLLFPRSSHFLFKIAFQSSVNYMSIRRFSLILYKGRVTQSNFSCYLQCNTDEGIGRRIVEYYLSRKVLIGRRLVHKNPETGNSTFLKRQNLVEICMKDTLVYSFLFQNVSR